MTQPLHHGRCVGPLRKIVAPGELGKIRLDCGHEIYNDTAIYRARCWKCAKEAEATASSGGADADR